MRQDETVADTLTETEEWKRDPESGEMNALIDTRVQDGDEIIDGKLRVHSISGHERNKLYVNQENGESFADVSGFSGLDDEADSRSAAFLDYDRDGWQDVVLVNAMNPLSRLFRNELGSTGNKSGMIAISLVGGNHEATTSEWSNRDGYGARIVVKKGDQVIEREHRCGEGYGSQNSKTIKVGIGDWNEVDEITVRWPSGKTSTAKSIKSGEWITIHEKGGEDRQAYQKATATNPASSPGGLRFPLKVSEDAKLTVWKGMATWCPVCARYRPQFEHLKKMTGGQGVQFMAFPIDKEESASTLKQYKEENDLPYELITNLPDNSRTLLTRFLGRLMGAEEIPLPTTVITNQKGQIVWYGAGAPSVSDLRKLLDGN